MNRFPWISAAGSVFYSAARKMKMVTEPEILLVDDEASIRLTLPLMLQSYGFKVSSAATVTEALRLMAEHRFDVLISDMNIDRGGDGFTVDRTDLLYQGEC